jgi:hypothetical protein
VKTRRVSLSTCSGTRFPGRPGPEAQSGAVDARGAILLTSLGDEGYELVVTPDGVAVRAPAARGLLHGVQSLRQLLPPEIESAEAAGGSTIERSLPSVRVLDRPQRASPTVRSAAAACVPASPASTQAGQPVCCSGSCTGGTCD